MVVTDRIAPDSLWKLMVNERIVGKMWGNGKTQQPQACQLTNGGSLAKGVKTVKP